MARVTMDLPDGSRYVGEVNEDGVPHGQGVRTWPDGGRYEGEYRDGAMARGTYTWPDGCSFTGEHEAEGEIERGVYTWPDGCQFEGTYRDGQPASGVLTKADGAMLTGEFGPAEGGGHGVQGAGVILLPDGTRFTNDAYRDSTAEGQGTAEYSDGNRYEGGWRGGKPHGHGVRTFSNGEGIEGKWRDGEFDGPWSAATVDPRRLRVVSGPGAGKTLAGLRNELRRKGVKVDEEAANKALAGAFNLCEAEGTPLMAVAHGESGPEVCEFEVVSPAGGAEPKAGRRRRCGPERSA